MSRDKAASLCRLWSLAGLSWTLLDLAVLHEVQEYSHLESRDLWEYRLALDPGSMDRFIRHLWEMGSASMSLFLFEQKLFLSAASAPGGGATLHASGGALLVKTTPADTLRRVIAQQGLLTENSLAPSHVSWMLPSPVFLIRTGARTSPKSWARRPDETNAKRLEAFYPGSPSRLLTRLTIFFRYRVGSSDPAGVGPGT